MASTNKTTHYELSQFVSSDIPAWLVDYNGDMSKIDIAINSAKTTADGAVTAAGNAQTAAEGAQNTANTAVTNAATADGKATTANTSIGTLANLNTTEKTTLVGAINEVNSTTEKKPVVLMYASGGTHGSDGVISLSETAANFSEIEIMYHDNNGAISTTGLIIDPDGKTVRLSGFFARTDIVYCKEATLSISGTTVSFTTELQYSVATNGTATISTGSNYFYVDKIIGYR